MIPDIVFNLRSEPRAKIAQSKTCLSPEVFFYRAFECNGSGVVRSIVWFCGDRPASLRRSKAVVLMLFLFCVALWFILWGASCFKVFPCSLSSCFFSPFNIVITSLGEGELVCVLLVRLFVCFLHVSCCPFSLPLDVGVGGL